MSGEGDGGRLTGLDFTGGGVIIVVSRRKDDLHVVFGGGVVVAVGDAISAYKLGGVNQTQGGPGKKKWRVEQGGMMMMIGFD